MSGSFVSLCHEGIKVVFLSSPLTASLHKIAKAKLTTVTTLVITHILHLIELNTTAHLFTYFLLSFSLPLSETSTTIILIFQLIIKCGDCNSLPKPYTAN